MLPSREIEAILSFISIYLHIKKLYNRFYLRGFSLSYNYIIKLILSSNGFSGHNPYSLSLNTLTSKQRLHLSSLLINMNNKKNEFLPSFDPFNQEFSPENCLTSRQHPNWLTVVAADGRPNERPIRKGLRVEP